MHSKGVQSYRKISVITSDPGKLILMCYEGAIDQLKIAKRKYNEKDYENKCKALTKAMNFIDELLCSLDFDRGGAIARNLSALYNYMNRRILQSDANRDIGGIDEVIGILTDLLSAWEEVVGSLHKKDRPESIEFNREGLQQAVNYIGI